MDKPAAARIIRDAFENPFDKGRFAYLVKNLLNDIDETKAFHAHGYVPESFRDYVRTYERIGTFTDPADNKVDVLIVHLQKETSLERARTAQRNFVARYLKERGEKEAALTAFVSPDPSDWRFSLVKMEYSLTETPSGKVKVKEEVTPARRWSFLVGKTESSHTAQSQLVDILADDKNAPTLPALESAFNIEVVTEEFFRKYRELFHKVKEALLDELQHNKRARDDFEAKDVDTVNFAKKLLGQVVFLYFLQKKGWFGVGRDEDWGTGPKDFLRRLFEKEIAPYDNFFNDVLEPLFYEALAVERTDDFYRHFNCKIPFLNGGLFDPINNYDWVHTDILLDNALFSNDEKTNEGDIGTGILDIFDRYNFTVKEDEPLEKDVAVDPEMLGKVFENLLEVKDRKSKGTYYTPREIVHYMCQETLINYLDAAVNTGEVPLVATPPPQSKLFGKPDPEQGALKAPGYRAIVPRADIEALIRKGELAIEHDARVESTGRETRNYPYKLPQAVRWNAKLLDDKLANIRVCDPAVGSGAFLVGMMTEIIRARNTLTTYLPDKQGRSRYRFKRDAIQDCLYGVDIDPGAVEIAKLRLWLSLVVDEEEIRQIQPLPNLDYKIMQGDSLIEDFHEISLAYEENGHARPKMFQQDDELLGLVEALNRQQDKLFKATHPSEKEQQKAEVENAIVAIFHHELKRQRGTYFQLLENIEQKASQIPKVEDRMKYYEAEKSTLDNKHGFDFEALERELREMTHGNKVRPFFPWRLYFANVFREKGGFDAVIANPPYISFGLRHNKSAAEEWANLMRKLYPGSAEYKISLYALFIDLAVRLTRKGGVICYITPDSFLLGRYFSKLRKTLLDNTWVTLFVMFLKNFWKSGVVGRPTISLYGKATNPRLTTAILAEDEKALSSAETREYTYSQEYFGHVPYNRFRLFFSPIAKKFVETIEVGSKPLNNVARITTGVRSKTTQNQITSMTRKGPNWKKAIISGSQVSGYGVRWEGHYINVDRELLFAGGWDQSIIEKPKIMIRQTGDSIIAGIDLSNLYHLNNVHSLHTIVSDASLHYICVLLNSRLMNRYYHLISLERGRAMAQTDIETLDLLPYREPDPETLEKIDSLFPRIDEVDSRNEAERILEQLYGLNEDLTSYLAGEDLYPKA